LGLLGDRHKTDIAEIMGVDASTDHRGWAQAKGQFRKWLSN
jgi:hypothetical protein